jgi:hypothetical protein
LDGGVPNGEGSSGFKTDSSEELLDSMEAGIIFLNRFSIGIAGLYSLLKRRSDFGEKVL